MSATKISKVLSRNLFTDAASLVYREFNPIADIDVSPQKPVFPQVVLPDGELPSVNIPVFPQYGPQPCDLTPPTVFGTVFMRHNMSRAEHSDGKAHTFGENQDGCTASVEDLVVLKEFRGLGVGGKLLEYAAKQAKLKNNKELYYKMFEGLEVLPYLQKKGFKATEEETDGDVPLSRLSLEQVDE